jgi:hypothetical protein
MKIFKDGKRNRKNKDIKIQQGLDGINIHIDKRIITVPWLNHIKIYTKKASRGNKYIMVAHFPDKNHGLIGEPENVKELVDTVAEMALILNGVSRPPTNLINKLVKEWGQTDKLEHLISKFQELTIKNIMEV